MGKVVQETNEKLKVLALLNKELFDDIRTKVQKDGPDPILNNFGVQLGRLVIKHADIEDEFGICVPDSVNIVKDDEHIEPA